VQTMQERTEQATQRKIGSAGPRGCNWPEVQVGAGQVRKVGSVER